MTNENSPEINALLGEAVASARAGNIDQARKIALSGLAATSGQSAPLLAFLGMVEARAGKLVDAAGHLRKAHELMPCDITVACNLLAILSELGDLEESLKVATERLMRDDRSGRVARIRGFAAQQLGDFSAAAEAYEFVLAQNPDDFECLNNLGNARAGLEDHHGAATALRRALTIDPEAAPTYLNLANALISSERFGEAEAVLLEATERFPTDPRPPYQCYILYKIVQRQDEALAILLQAMERDPNVAGMHLKLAIEYGVLRQTEAAERAYFRAIELNPLERDAYLGLAVQYEHTNREDQLAALVVMARENGLPAEEIAFVEALELRRTGSFEEALRKLEVVPADVEPIRTTHTKATLLDRTGRTDDAFATFCAANSLLIETPTDPIGRARSLRESLRGEVREMTAEWHASWEPREILDARADPTFLVGFPRSGTTLLDTLLMGHRDTVVMEEQPPLNLVEETLEGIGSLPTLSASDIREARDLYFGEVSKVADWDGRRMLIDKSPLFIYRLPLIHRLFPRAKVILALRHPCDVVLSCFMSNFRLNSGMANFLRLEDAAEFYDLSFTHWLRARELLDVDVHQIIYENLVEDVEATVRPLTEWLGLEWNAELLDHTKTAKSRGLITTASYSQVTEPIYKRAKGRWLRYRDHLAPIFDTLAPWALRFGYADPHDEAAERY